MTEIESCPAKSRKSSTHPANSNLNWRDCPITSRTVPCRICGTTDYSVVLCPKNWWVCDRCFTEHCPKLRPENPNPIEGKVTWIEA